MVGVPEDLDAPGGWGDRRNLHGDVETTMRTPAVDDGIDVGFEGGMDRVAQEIELLETQQFVVAQACEHRLVGRVNFGGVAVHLAHKFLDGEIRLCHYLA